jgi:hypothetical protein
MAAGGAAGRAAPALAETPGAPRAGADRVNRESTEALSPERLAELLEIGLRAEAAARPAGGDRAARALLAGLLSGEPPADTAAAEALARMAERLRRQTDLPDEPLGRALLRAETPLAALRALKANAKGLVLRSRSQAERAVVTAIYYAAIASGLKFHDRRITKLPAEELAGSFDTLAGRRWMPGELARHLADAAALCRRRAGPRPQGTAQ